MNKSKQKKKKPAVTFQAKCLAGHVYTMSESDLKAANANGVATCPTCGSIAFVTQIGATK